jgi:hypothetical protein
MEIVREDRLRFGDIGRRELCLISKAVTVESIAGQSGSRELGHQRNWRWMKPYIITQHFVRL